MAELGLSRAADELRGLMQTRNLSISAVARELGVSRQQVHFLLKGMIRFSATSAVKLERAFGVPAEDWVAWQAHHDLTQARMSLRDAEETGWTTWQAPERRLDVAVFTRRSVAPPIGAVCDGPS